MTDPALWYAMPALTGSRIRLEPLRVEHAEDYLAAAGDPEIFRWQSPAEGALAHPSTIEDARRHIIRLGARPEGVLRKHRRRADGSWRDTVIYAVVDDDRPAVRQGLRERL